MTYYNNYSGDDNIIYNMVINIIANHAIVYMIC